MTYLPRAALAALLLALPVARSAHAQQATAAPESRRFRTGSFDVWVHIDYFSRENRSSATLAPRGEGTPGELLWACAEGGGLRVGVTLADSALGDEARPLVWQFDDDAPKPGALVGIQGFRRWYLPPDDVAGFTVRARAARTLTLRVQGATAFAYDLAQPAEALEELVCARGTPVAGRLPRSTTGLSGQGRAVP